MRVCVSVCVCVCVCVCASVCMRALAARARPEKGYWLLIDMQVTKHETQTPSHPGLDTKHFSLNSFYSTVASPKGSNKKPCLHVPSMLIYVHRHVPTTSSAVGTAGNPGQPPRI